MLLFLHQSTADLDSIRSVSDLDSSIGENIPDEVTKRTTLSSDSPRDISNRVNASGEFLTRENGEIGYVNDGGTESDIEDSSEGQIEGNSQTDGN